jgi:hypothetical protein
MPETALINTPSAGAQIVSAQPQPSAISERNPDHVAAAVARCQQAWSSTYDPLITKLNEDSVSEIENQSESVVQEILNNARIVANDAYREAMPPLSSRENIQCFIGCVTYGVLSGVIPERLSRSLLYAAQVASSNFRSEPRPVGRPRKSEGGN